MVYTALSLYQIDLPGLHYDEAFEAVPALQLLQNQPVTTFRGHGLNLGGQTFPLMTQDYIGALNTYLAVPFIAALGPTPAALRIMSIFIGLVTLGLAYLLTTQLTGSRQSGWVAALLLAVDPTFIFWNRQGIFVTSVTAAIGLAATVCWLRRARGGSCRWTIAGAFLFGLGLYAKLLFLWLIAALVGAVVLLNAVQIISTLKTLIRTLARFKAETLGGFIAFLFGCWPLIVYNIQTGGTFLNVTQNAQTSYYGVNNLAIGSNLAQRLSQFIVILNGGQLWYLGNVWSTPLPSVIFGVVLSLIIYLSIRKNLTRFPSNFYQPFDNHLTLRQPPNHPTTKLAFFPFLVIALVVLTSVMTVSALWPTHFALLMPWPTVAIVTGGWFILQTARQNIAKNLLHITYYVLYISLGLLISVNLLNTGRYHLSLTESGGLSSHSDAVYHLSDWLAAHAQGPVAAMDWGLAAPVIYLTAGRVSPVEVFGYAWESDAELTARLTGLLDQPATLYLWRAPDEIIFDRSGQFKALYRPRQLEENIEEAFYERSGRPLLGVTRLVPAGAATNRP